MKQKLDAAAKTESSVNILKDHIEHVSIKSLNGDWIQDNKIDLDSIMEDNHSGAHLKASSRLFHIDLD